MLKLFVIVICFQVTILQSQNLNQDIVRDIAENAIGQIINTKLSDDNYNLRNCIYKKEIEYPTLCFEYSWIEEWTTDFDKDGIDDIVILITESGPKNYYQHQFNIITLTQEKGIKKVYSQIFADSNVVSRNLLINSVNDGKVYTTYTPNLKMYESFSKPNQGKIPLVFYLDKGIIMEESYAYCPMDNIDKTIFNTNITIKGKKIVVEKKVLLNQLYQVEQNEKLQINNGRYTASISGCDSFNLKFNYLSTQHNYKTLDTINLEATKSIIIPHITFLQKQTKYADLLSNLKLKLEQLDFNTTNLVTKEKRISIKGISISNNSNADVYITLNDDDVLSICLDITKAL